MQQHKFAQLDEEKHLHMDKSECKKLLNVVSEEKTATDKDGNQQEQNKRPAGSLVGNAFRVTEKSKFKRNKAKGPNPLSCKKKRLKPQPSAAQSQDVNSPDILRWQSRTLVRSCDVQGPKADDEVKRMKVRKRKRSRKDNDQTETAS